MSNPIQIRRSPRSPVSGTTIATPPSRLATWWLEGWRIMGALLARDVTR